MEEIIKIYTDKVEKANDELLLVTQFAKIVDYWNKRKEFTFSDDSDNDPATFKLFETPTFYLNGGFVFDTWILDLGNYINVYKFCTNNKNAEVTKLEEKYENNYTEIKKLQGALRFIRLEFEKDNLKIWKIAELFEDVISDRT